MNLLPLLLTAFGLGLVHSFDVDHLCAVTSFSSHARSVREAFWLGVRWAVGHTAALLFFGLALVALKAAAAPWVNTVTELCVGVVLLGVGIWVIRDVFRHEQIHGHWHEHNGTRHFHLHSHKHNERHAHGHALALIGLLHGLAGTSAVMVLIPVMLLHSVVSAGLYILVFGVGTVVSMGLFGACAGKLFALVSRWQRALSALKGCVGLASCLVGAIWIVRNLPAH
jgi:sulfite exporter TauE/SafE